MEEEASLEAVEVTVGEMDHSRLVMSHSGELQGRRGRRSPASPSWRRRSSPTSGLSCGSCWWAAGASGTARTAAPGPRPSRGRQVERLGGEHHSSHSYISACGMMHDLSLPFLTIPYLSLPYWALFCTCALTYYRMLSQQPK